MFVDRPTRRRRRLATVLAAVPAAALLAAPGTLSPPASAAPGDRELTYELELLPTTGNASWANGVTQSGLVVGTARTTTDARPQVATSWDAAGERAELGALEGATFSRVFDANSTGDAVGEGFTPSPEVSKPLLWTADGELVVLPSLNPSGTGVANDINERGRIVGAGFNGTNGRAWIGGTERIRELPLPDAEGPVGTTRATAIADDGAVVGVSFVAVDHGDHTDNVDLATVWRDFEAATLPGTIEDAGSTAYGVNEVGTVVGEEADAPHATTRHAIVWRDGEPTALPRADDLAHARAVAVNDGGLVVGYVSGFYGNPSFNGRAVAWDDDELVELNDLVDLPEGVVLRSAADVNDEGVIVGSASTPDGTRAFRLVPITPGSAEITVADVPPVEYGQDFSLPVSAAVDGSPAEGEIGVTVGGSETVAPLVDGTASLMIPGGRMRPGRHDLIVAHRHNGAEVTEPVTVRIVRARPVVRLRATDSTRPRLVVRVEAPGSRVSIRGYVSIRVDGQVVEVARVQDGRTRLSLGKLARGRHRVVVRFLATELARAASGRLTVRAP